MTDPASEKKGLTFFQQIGGELSITPEQQAAVEEMRKEGLKESLGLPLVYPKIKLLHQDTAAFQFVEEDVLVKSFKAIIIAVEPSRVWWRSKLGSGEDGSGGMPQCFSRNLIMPDAQAEDRQAPRCAECSQNAWGSDIKQDGSPGRGKSCKEIRRVFVLPENHMSPHWLAIPPSSLRALSSFIISVVDKGFKKPQEVVCSFSAKTQENKDGVSFSELSLALGERVPETVLAMIAMMKKNIEKVLETAAPVSQDDYSGKEAVPGENT
jgi:hypothetical protein